MKKIFLLALILSCSLQAAPLPTEKNVDVSRYVGKWYAHYSLPQFFTRKCVGQTAEYEVIDDKTISVLNTCLKEKGQETIDGQAVVQNPGDNSRLIVTFDTFWTRLFRVKGDYNIIRLDPDYQVVLVGSKDRKSLWLMARYPQEIPEQVRASYLKTASELGYDISRLVKSRF